MQNYCIVFVYIYCNNFINGFSFYFLHPLVCYEILFYWAVTRCVKNSVPSKFQLFYVCCYNTPCIKYAYTYLKTVKMKCTETITIILLSTYIILKLQTTLENARVMNLFIRVQMCTLCVNMSISSNANRIILTYKSY